MYVYICTYIYAHMCMYIHNRNTCMCICMCLHIHIQNTKKNTYFVRVLVYFLSFKKYIYFSQLLLTSLPIHNHILSLSQKQNKQKSKQTKKVVRQKKNKNCTKAKKGGGIGLMCQQISPGHGTCLGKYKYILKPSLGWLRSSKPPT